MKHIKQILAIFSSQLNLHLQGSITPLKRQNIRKPLAYGTIAMLLMLSACGVGVEHNTEEATSIEETTENLTEHKPMKGGSISFAIRNPITLNPLLNEEETVDMLLSLVYEPLLCVTADGRLENVILSNYSFDETGKILTLHINEEVYFHNEKRLTSDDVIYSIETIKSSSDNSIYKAMGEDIIGYRKVDSNTLTITFESGGYKSLYYLTFPIVSKEHFSKADNKLITMGTGSYMLEDFKTMKELTLIRANENAHVDRVVGVITYDKETDLYTFNQEMIDVVFFDNASMGKFAVEREYIKEDNDINLCEIMGFNFEKSMFQDGNLRRAIEMVIPKEEILNVYYLNNGSVAGVPINPKYYYNGVENAHTHNLQAAYVLLKDSGYFAEESVLKRGFTEIKFTILINSENAQRKQVAERIKSELGGLNIHCEIEAVPFDTYMERISLRDYDVFLGGLQMSHIPDLSFAFSSTSDKNLIAYKNPTMDILLSEMRSSVTENEFLNTQKKLQEFIMNDVPYITIAFKNDVIIKGKNIVGNFNPVITRALKTFDDVYVVE